MVFENLIDKKELSQRIGVSVKFIDKWMTLGLPYLKVGRLVRFKWSEVVRWLERRSHGNKD